MIIRVSSSASFRGAPKVTRKFVFTLIVRLYIKYRARKDEMYAIDKLYLIFVPFSSSPPPLSHESNFCSRFLDIDCPRDPCAGIPVVIGEISARMASGRRDIKLHRGVALENRVILRRRVVIVLTVTPRREENYIGRRLSSGCLLERDICDGGLGKFCRAIILTSRPKVENARRLNCVRRNDGLLYMCAKGFDYILDFVLLKIHILGYILDTKAPLAPRRGDHLDT